MVFATGARWLALRWTPTFDGNRPITSFIIYQQDINTTTTSIMQVGILEVGSLMFRNGSFRYNISEDIIPFNNYQFAVQACNVLGCGNVSAPSPITMTLPVVPQILDQPDNLTVVEPEDATFSCLATGRPRPTIAWFRLSDFALLQSSFP